MHDRVNFSTVGTLLNLLQYTSLGELEYLTNMILVNRNNKLSMNFNYMIGGNIIFARMVAHNMKNMDDTNEIINTIRMKTIKTLRKDSVREVTDLKTQQFEFIEPSNESNNASYLIHIYTNDTHNATYNNFGKYIILLSIHVSNFRKNNMFTSRAIP